MANNRMYLVYRPTGDAVYLGKHMGEGWYGTPENVGEQIKALFAEIWPNPGQEALCLAMEDAAGEPFILENWQYPPGRAAEGGILRKLVLHPDDAITLGEMDLAGIIERFFRPIPWQAWKKIPFDFLVNRDHYLHGAALIDGLTDLHKQYRKDCNRCEGGEG